LDQRDIEMPGACTGSIVGDSCLCHLFCNCIGHLDHDLELPATECITHPGSDLPQTLQLLRMVIEFHIGTGFLNGL
jgi:hypothetical protein